MRRVQFANEYFYHIYNRGTDKRKIFLDEKDYFRFIHCLFEFNNSRAVLNASFRFACAQRTQNYGGETSIVKRERDRLVDIISFCLMPNHFHLILKQLKDNGIAKFMQKLGTGYTMYFNKKQDRNGALFQGVFKAILIDRDEYFLPLSGYIHSNPIEIINANWKEKGIRNWLVVNKFLKNYRWSSYLDYIGIKNFPSITSRNFLLNYFKSDKGYQEFFKNYLGEDIKKSQEFYLD